MDLNLDNRLAKNYKSNSQRARVMTESWMAENMFCPVCGNRFLNHFTNNKPVADFYCKNCSSEFELKSKRGQIGSRIVDGAYNSMINRITCNNNPHLFLMSYSLSDYTVSDVTIIPKHFFTPTIIEKRKPLGNEAKRVGWIGCNILISEIPYQGKISIIKNQKEVPKSVVTSAVRQSFSLETNDISGRSWLLEVLSCVNKIPHITFSLQDVYTFEDYLSIQHPDNYNIRPKIRQQLQILRDKGLIEFVGRGIYRKL